MRLESGALAGSVLTLDQAVRHAAAWFCVSIGAAAELASGVAVRLLGLDGRKGTLAVGADADICLLDRAVEGVRDGCWWHRRIPARMTSKQRE